MKFGGNLHKNQVPHWAPFYINYNRLKQLYKLASIHAHEHGEDVDFTEFISSLEHDLNRIEEFYDFRLAIVGQRATALSNHYGTSPGLAEHIQLNRIANHELEDLTAAFTELRDALKELQWYGVVNSRIIAKLRKFQLGSPGDSEVELPNGSQLMVTKQARCLKRLQELNSLIAKFRRGLLRPRSDSTAESIFLQNFCSQLDPPLLSSSALYQAIRRDDSFTLDQLLGVYAFSDPKSGEQFPGLLPALLQCSVLCVSRKCVNSLLSQGASLQDGDQSLHWLISKIGRRVKAKGRWSREEPAILDSIDKDSLHILTYIIDRVNPGHERVFNQVDSLGRIPLHHAVDYGLPNICQGILKHMFQRSASPSPGLIQDTEGLTPLHLAVFSGNTAVTNMLLEDMESKRALKLATDVDNTNVVPGSLLIIAIKSDHIRIFKLLAKSTINLNYRDSNGEAALYIAVRTGNQDYVKILLEASASHKELDLDIAENTYGRTPLIMACVMGNLQIMELLLQAGANSGSHDIFGWTAKDHASFRGYLVLAKSLIENNISSTALSVNTEHQADLKTTGFYSTQPKQIGKKGAASSLQLPCTHGQSIPIGESQILVNLGALDSYKHVLAVDLSPYVSPATYTPQLAADFVVEIRALGGDETSSVIQLPIIEDMANKPWRFLTKDPSNFKLVFNIFPATAVGLEGNMVIGSAVALLGSLKQGLGLKRESLIRDFTIPILQKETLKYMGSLTFYFLVVTPFPNPLSTFKATLEMGKGTNPIIIGHRGTGQNDPTRKQLQIGENTLQSFLSAVDLGASYIEFDIQLTKDLIPIAYHDFLMSETGIDAPLHTLSFEQFMCISKAQSTYSDLPSMAEMRYLERSGGISSPSRRQRSLSLSVYEDSRAKDLAERMKHTFEFKLQKSKGSKQVKGNTRSDYIQASFMTLEELLIQLPESVNFDIEIKYPMLFEAHDWGMDTYAIELNTLVDTILGKVYKLGGNRTIFFSSFSPEICILLSAKQNSYPVLFLTESGHIPSADARASSLQEAIHFAKSWSLPGVISRSEPLVMSPGLVEFVKGSGLVCISWGGLNDDPKNANAQAQEGLDAIIANNVGLISQTLGNP